VFFTEVTITEGCQTLAVSYQPSAISLKNKVLLLHKFPKTLNLGYNIPMILLLTNFDDAQIQKWLPHLQHHLPNEKIAVYPNFDENDIDVALVANPPQGVLATLPNLKLIQSLWAGVDTLMRDPTLPKHVPLARLVDPELTQAMIESVVTHVLMLHRQIPAYQKQQRDKVWRQLEQPGASQRTVAMLGLGQLGSVCAKHLKQLGFTVIGWSATEKKLEHIPAFHGEAAFQKVLGQADIVVNLLPLTTKTKGIFNTKTFERIKRGSGLINVARGAHVVEEHLLNALESGQLGYAVLDVFTEEPLPEEHPFWNHPNIIVLPHVAAITNPVSASKIVAQNVVRLRSGEAVENLVNVGLGY
jgi:glyoxylate/hydroxypyruvate reductase